MITRMGVRGIQQSGRTGAFPPDRLVRGVVPFHPGDPLRTKYERAVKGMGVSGAEVLRYALERLELDSNGRPPDWTGLQEEIPDAS